MDKGVLIEREVEVTTATGPTCHKGWSYADWAAVKVPDADLIWMVVHLPTGGALPFTFRALDDAAAAMEGVQKLRNNWAITAEELIEQPELMGLIATICFKAGGRDVSLPAIDETVQATKNGYANWM